jgi:hypothetical protein
VSGGSSTENAATKKKAGLEKPYEKKPALRTLSAETERRFIFVVRGSFRLAFAAHQKAASFTSGGLDENPCQNKERYREKCSQYRQHDVGDDGKKYDERKQYQPDRSQGDFFVKAACVVHNKPPCQKAWRLVSITMQTIYALFVETQLNHLVQCFTLWQSPKGLCRDPKFCRRHYHGCRPHTC